MSAPGAGAREGSMGSAGSTGSLAGASGSTGPMGSTGASGSLAGASAQACACAQREEPASFVPDTCAIVVAGGSGERFGDPRGKQFVPLCGLPLLCWPLMAIDRAPSVRSIIVVCPGGRIEETRDRVVRRVQLRCEVTLVEAGATRQESVANGLAAMPRDVPIVAIHDGARPLIETEAVERAIGTVRENEDVAGAICAQRCTDTLKLVEDGAISATPDRTQYWSAQTPQVFARRTIMAAHGAARWEGYQGTDDASLVERRGGRVVVVESSRGNIKVTMPEDLAIAEAIMEQRLVEAGHACAKEGADS